MSEETKETTWDEYVRSEVNALLDIYIPESLSGNVGIKYNHKVISTDEGGAPVEFDKNVLTGVNIQLVFDFGEGLEIVDEPK